MARRHGSAEDDPQAPSLIGVNPSTKKRTMRIYLFTNNDFGLEFQKVACRLVREKNVNIIMVFSGKRKLPIGRARQFLFKILVFFKDFWRAILLTRRLDMSVFIVDNVNSASFLKMIHDDDHGIIAGFDQIFKANLISKFNTLVNWHPSVLPLYRGPLPAYWCLQNGEDYSGYSLHWVTAEIDRGEIIWQEAVPILSSDNQITLTQRIASSAAHSFGRYVLSLHESTDFPRKLINAYSIYHHHVDYNSFPEHTNVPKSAFKRLSCRLWG